VEHLRSLLETATTIELVDWPHQDVPATLIRAGYDVVGHEPDGFRRYEIVDEQPPGRLFPLTDGGYLGSEKLAALPTGIDIVNTYRPAEEQPGIARGAVETCARAFWVQPGEDSSDEARSITQAAGLVFVDGVDIAQAVRELDVHVASR
jgi:hypothetical protein